MATPHHVGSRCKEVAWYDDALVEIDQPARDLLENYSKYAAHEVIPSVNEMRDLIWDVFPWPCVGQFRFLDLSLSRHDLYPRILADIKEGRRFLDVGCCMAQDIRKMVYDGAPAENLWALEVQGEFIDLGYKLFRDGHGDGRLKAHFVTADLLDRTEPQLQAVQGTFGIVQMGMILHIWDRQGQLAACRRVVELLRPEPDSLVVGQCVGHLDGVEESHGTNGKKMLQHNAETFRSMWDELGHQTGTSWEVNAHLDESLHWGEGKQQHWSGPRVQRLVFSVVRK
ncbi:hypothetical protein QQS21_000647 [Conoideocrella luteorostrata]|uniref:Methyltransferase domain-containing protein n=1 Tax=Conoideocrella luteorostrata TaxID=1105319 RepID=A0AAJ0D0Q9_9HYPO|nr:hypothetical protein QQS21_000647 [Conoideocrella luteorostrata]